MHRDREGWRSSGPSENGIALAVALFALVVVGALVAGAFFAGLQEQRAGESVRREVQALGVAEEGAYEVLRTWNPRSINDLRWFPNDAFDVPEARAGGAGYYGGQVLKLNRNLYLVDVTGSDPGPGEGMPESGARRRVAILARARIPDMGPRAALAAPGGVQLGANADVDGSVHVPPGWASCDSLADTAGAGIRTPHAGLVHGGRIAGEPPILEDPTLSDSSFVDLGGLRHAELAAHSLAGDHHIPIVAPRSTASGACDVTVATNWGDPARRAPAAPCADFFPIVHVAGNLTVGAGQGQGILLVDGDLELEGAFAWFGVAIIGGRLRVAGDGQLWGAVAAREVELDARGTGRATVMYSKCAIVNALQSSARVSVLRSRRWVQLF